MQSNKINDVSNCLNHLATIDSHIETRGYVKAFNLNRYNNQGIFKDNNLYEGKYCYEVTVKENG